MIRSGILTQGVGSLFLHACFAIAQDRKVLPLWKTFHNGNYAEKRIMSGNGLPPQVIRSRQPRPFA